MADGSSAAINADAPTAAATDAWTHLTGVYDAGAGEARLYVDGTLVATSSGLLTGPVAGNLVIGRGRTSGAPDRFFAGEIDDVHVYSGVLSDPAINADSGRTAPRPPSLFAGSFSRYVSNDAQHFVGTGPPPPGFHLEWPMGMPAPAGAPGTWMVYSCRYNGGYFLSLSSGCENHEVLGQAGALYSTPPAGEPTVPLYRCVILANGDHFIAHADTCESTPEKIKMEGLLGYARRTAPLISYVGPGGRHWTSSNGQLIPAGYSPAARLGYVSTGGIDPAPALHMCGSATVPGDEFLSTDTGCESQRDLGISTGWAWPSAPAGAAASQQLYACRDSGGERFESLDPLCDGGDTVRPLGYVITRF
jgi:hypothetical protein